MAQAALAVVNFGLPAVGPQLQEEYGLGLFALGAIVSAGLLGSGCGLMLAGALVDRRGARRILMFGTGAATASLVAAAFVSSGFAVFLALVAFGVGSAVVPVAGAATLLRVFPPERRGWALGVRQTAVPLGGLVAAGACPALYAAGGTRALFLAAAACVGLTGWGFAAVVDDTRAPGRREGSWRTIAASPGMGRLLLVAACYITTLQTLVAYVVPAVRAAGASGASASAAYVALNVAGVLGRIAWGRIADRDAGTRRTRTLVEIGAVSAVGAALFALALHAGPFAFLPAAALFGAGALGWNAVLYLTAGERVEPALAGRSVALAATVVFVISGLATPLLGAVAERAGWDALWVLVGAASLAGAFLVRKLPPLQAAPTD